MKSRILLFLWLLFFIPVISVTRLIDSLAASVDGRNIGKLSDEAAQGVAIIYGIGAFVFFLFSLAERKSQSN